MRLNTQKSALFFLQCSLLALVGCASKHAAYMSAQQASRYCTKQAALVETNIEICSKMLMQSRLYVKPCLDSGEIPGSAAFAECALKRIRIDQSRSEARERRDKERRIEALENEVQRMNQERELRKMQQQRN